eukprot:TRINITY_DN2213_c2_g3_i2.p1 TRINITY_DN2213_c2_g3~~TRINITY_DN2213_c2_g3_i2.p1  ORF type:complete len:1105 (+),score=276.18 TRINITY_DN2213_c2_g3_i2:108-3422(+)
MAQVEAKPCVADLATSPPPCSSVCQSGEGGEDKLEPTRVFPCDIKKVERQYSNVGNAPKGPTAKACPLPQLSLVRSEWDTHVVPSCDEIKEDRCPPPDANAVEQPGPPGADVSPPSTSSILAAEEAKEKEAKAKDKARGEEAKGKAAVAAALPADEAVGPTPTTKKPAADTTPAAADEETPPEAHEDDVVVVELRNGFLNVRTVESSAKVPQRRRARSCELPQRKTFHQEAEATALQGLSQLLSNLPSMSSAGHAEASAVQDVLPVLLASSEDCDVDCKEGLLLTAPPARAEDEEEDSQPCDHLDGYDSPWEGYFGGSSCVPSSMQLMDLTGLGAPTAAPVTPRGLWSGQVDFDTEAAQAQATWQATLGMHRGCQSGLWADDASCCSDFGFGDLPRLSPRRDSWGAWSDSGCAAEEATTSGQGSATLGVSAAPRAGGTAVRSGGADTRSSSYAIHVSGLAPSTTDAQLFWHFKQAGYILPRSCRVFTDRSRGKWTSYGKVEFAEASSQRWAIKDWHKSWLNDRVIYVREFHADDARHADAAGSGKGKDTGKGKGKGKGKEEGNGKGGDSSNAQIIGNSYRRDAIEDLGTNGAAQQRSYIAAQGATKSGWRVATTSAEGKATLGLSAVPRAAGTAVRSGGADTRSSAAASAAADYSQHTGWNNAQRSGNGRWNQAAHSQPAQSQAVKSQAAKSQTAKSQAAQSQAAQSQVVQSQAAQSQAAVQSKAAKRKAAKTQTAQSQEVQSQAAQVQAVLSRAGASEVTAPSPVQAQGNLAAARNGGREPKKKVVALWLSFVTASAVEHDLKKAWAAGGRRKKNLLFGGLLRALRRPKMTEATGRRLQAIAKQLIVEGGIIQKARWLRAKRGEIVNAVAELLDHLSICLNGNHVQNTVVVTFPPEELRAIIGRIEGRLLEYLSRELPPRVENFGDRLVSRLLQHGGTYVDGLSAECMTNFEALCLIKTGRWVVRNWLQARPTALRDVVETYVHSFPGLAHDERGSQVIEEEIIAPARNDPLLLSRIAGEFLQASTRPLIGLVSKESFVIHAIKGLVGCLPPRGQPRSNELQQVVDALSAPGVQEELQNIHPELQRGQARSVATIYRILAERT